MRHRDQLRNVDATSGARDLRHDNRTGLQGIDHVGWPTMDLDLISRFIEQILGGEVYCQVGFDSVDREMGRTRHIFLRVGSSLIQCAEPEDGRMIISREDPNAFPHWAFRVSKEAMENHIVRLHEHGIPFEGPYRHRGVDNVSLYFASPEGHKIELSTWDPYPESRAPIKGGTGSRAVNWLELMHDWSG